MDSATGRGFDARLLYRRVATLDKSFKNVPSASIKLRPHGAIEIYINV